MTSGLCNRNSAHYWFMVVPYAMESDLLSRSTHSCLLRHLHSLPTRSPLPQSLPPSSPPSHPFLHSPPTHSALSLTPLTPPTHPPPHPLAPPSPPPSPHSRSTLQTPLRAHLQRCLFRGGADQRHVVPRAGHHRQLLGRVRRSIIHNIQCSEICTLRNEKFYTET